MDLTVHQLMAMRSLLPHGWPSSMADILLRRCGLGQPDWDMLVDHRLVLLDKEDRYQMSKSGKRLYQKLKKSKYF